MDSAIKVVGWLLAAAAIVAAAMLFSQVKTLRSDLDLAEAQTAVEAEQVETVELANLRAKLERTLEEKRTADMALAEAEARIEDFEEQARVTSERALAAERPEESAAEAQETEAEKAERQARNRERQQTIQRAQASIMLDMAYKTLFDELNLPPEVQSQMRELLVQSWADQQGTMQKAMRTKDKTFREMKQLEDEALAELRAGLIHVLNGEEIAAWEDYETYKDQYIFENLLEGQLGMLAPGLTPDNRATTKVVLAEELAFAFEESEESDEVFSLNAFNDTQLIGLERGLERIAQELDDDQYAEVEGFVRQAAAMFDALAEQ